MTRVIGVLLSLLLLAVVIGGFAGRRFFLVAKENIAVSSYPVPGPVSVGRMQAGERAIVLSCDDLKSYPAIHVRLANGTEGYIVEGVYELNAAPVWDLSAASPINFICPAF